jgi:parvulin-like peptidyl-prolyl isomerase
MLRIAFCIALFVGWALAQISHPDVSDSRVTTGVSSSVAKRFNDSASLAPSDPVLSIHGVCSETENSSSDDCTVVVSRQRFDDLMNILAPGAQVAARMKQSFAKTYAELLAFDSAARESGIDNSPQYRETMQWLQLKTLADLFRRRLEKESRTVSEAEIEGYYCEHISQFEEVKLRRLVLPKNNFAIADTQKFEQNAQRVAAELRERAANGEDLERLQKEAYETLGFNGLPPATDVGNRRRTNVPSEVSEEVFSLRPGEVSKVERETYSFVIYKVEAKWALPEEQVREEISREIAEQKLERALNSITGNIRTELNEKYFGTASAR